MDKGRKKLSRIYFCRDATVSGRNCNFVAFLPGAAPQTPSVLLEEHSPASLREQLLGLRAAGQLRV